MCLDKDKQNHPQEPEPELTSTVGCFTTCSSVPSRCSKPILLEGSSTDCLVTCSSLVSHNTLHSNLDVSTDEKTLYRPETSLLRAETRLGLPYLSLSYCRQLHSGLSWLEVEVSDCWWDILSSVLSSYCASCPSWQSTGGYNTSTGRQSMLNVSIVKWWKTPDVRPVSSSGWRAWAGLRCFLTSPTLCPACWPSGPLESSPSSFLSSARKLTTTRQPA